MKTNFHLPPHRKSIKFIHEKSDLKNGSASKKEGGKNREKKKNQDSLIKSARQRGKISHKYHKVTAVLIHPYATRNS